MTGHVFISYSRKDTAYVERLVAFLASAGVQTWTDSGIEHGDRWAQTIRAKVDSCIAVIPVMTPAAENSTWVEREIARAEELNKPILPLLLSGKPFFRLGHLQHDDVTGDRMPGQRYLNRLTAVVTEARASPALTPAPVGPDHGRYPWVPAVGAPPARVGAPPEAAQANVATTTTSAGPASRRRPWEPVATVLASAVVLLVAVLVFKPSAMSTLGASAVACALAFPHLRWTFPTLVAVLATLRLLPSTEGWGEAWSLVLGVLLVILLVTEGVRAKRNHRRARQSPAFAVASAAAVTATWVFETFVRHSSTIRPLWPLMPYVVLLFYLVWEADRQVRRAAVASVIAFGALSIIYQSILITGLLGYGVVDTWSRLPELACAVLIVAGGLRARRRDL